MTQYSTTTDGRRVVLGPHSPDGHPDYGNPDVGIGGVAQQNIAAHQEAILRRLDEWDLWQYFGEAGRMADEYRKARKQDPEMDILVRLAKLAVGKKTKLPKRGTEQWIELVPQNLWNYPLPSKIYQGHQYVGTADWLIDQEMKAVYAFFLENVNPDPFVPDHPEFEVMKGLNLAERQQVAQKYMVKVRFGPHDVLIIGPCSGKAFTLFDDAMMPRGMPGTKLVRYDHSDPKHNPALRGEGGFMRADAYLELPKEEVAEATEAEPKQEKSNGKRKKGR